MTKLTKAVSRNTLTELDGSFGSDRGRTIAVRLVPAHGTTGAVIELWPIRTRQVERVLLSDVLRFAIRSRANLSALAKAREQKERIARRRESARISRADAKLRREAKLNR